jgi:hypothetical protein
MALALEQAIYRDHFGPTFVTLARHLVELFPDYATHGHKRAQEAMATTIVNIAATTLAREK